MRLGAQYFIKLNLPSTREHQHTHGHNQSRPVSVHRMYTFSRETIVMESEHDVELKNIHSPIRI
jgi:hypothetical protein